MITEDELAKWQGWVEKGYSLTPPKCGALIAEVRGLQAERTKDKQLLASLIEEKDAADKKIAAILAIIG